MFVVIYSDYEEYEVLYAGESIKEAWKAAEKQKYGGVEVQYWLDGAHIESWYYTPAYKKWE